MGPVLIVGLATLMLTARGGSGPSAAAAAEAANQKAMSDAVSLGGSVAGLGAAAAVSLGMGAGVASAGAALVGATALMGVGIAGNPWGALAGANGFIGIPATLGFRLGSEASHALGWDKGPDKGAGTALVAASTGVGVAAGAGAVLGVGAGAAALAATGVGALVVGSVYAANELFDSGGKAAARAAAAKFAGEHTLDPGRERDLVFAYVSWMGSNWGFLHDANGHLRIGLESGALRGQDLGAGMLKLNGHVFNYQAGKATWLQGTVMERMLGTPGYGV